MCKIGFNFRNHKAFEIQLAYNFVRKTKFKNINVAKWRVECLANFMILEEMSPLFFEFSQTEYLVWGMVLLCSIEQIRNKHMKESKFEAEL